MSALPLKVDVLGIGINVRKVPYVKTNDLAASCLG